MKNVKQKPSRVIIVICGVFIGVINGFFGGGGGMVAVPVLEKLLAIDNKKSHSTAIAVIFPICIASAIVYGIKTKIQWLIVLVLTLGVILGGIVGALLLKKISGKVIRLIFAILMLASGIFSILKAVEVI